MDGSPAWKAPAKLVWIDRGNFDMQYEVGKSRLSRYGNTLISIRPHRDTEPVLVLSWSSGFGS